jgi:hypothetical protein
MTKTTIKMLRNPAGSIGCQLLEGETGEVGSELADMLVASGLAVVAVPDEIKAVPDPPSIVAPKQSTTGPLPGLASKSKKN